MGRTHIPKPPTAEETSHIAKVRPGKPILCSKCGRGGGTLVKQDDGYVHQNKELCKILQGRR